MTQSAINTQTGLTFDIYDSVKSLDIEGWNSVLKYQNIYLSTPYLKALEDTLDHIKFAYTIVKRNDNPIGILYTQVVNISKSDINVPELQKKMKGLLPKFIVNAVNFNILICGNAFATGENGYFFSTDAKVNESKIVSDAIQDIIQFEKNRETKISMVFIKEFWEKNFDHTSGFNNNSYNSVNIDANMVLSLSEKWESFDNFLECFNSKFRTKAKGVVKKSSAIEIIDFNIQNHSEYIDHVDKLYNDLVDKANFTFGRLNGQALFAMKRTLGENFLFKGYFIDNKLIGFSSATSFNNVLDGNYIGLDYSYNQQYAVYQRMLYDFIDYAIVNNLTEVRIGRTAEQIKSGVGALPVNMRFYAKHTNRVMNLILKPIVSRLEPSTFELRKPFKAEYYK